MTLIKIIRTPDQVEEAYELLQRWRKLNRVADDELADKLRSQFRHAVYANLADALPDHELITIQGKAAGAAMAHLNSLRAEVEEALLKLGVDPKAEETDET